MVQVQRGDGQKRSGGGAPPPFSSWVGQKITNPMLEDVITVVVNFQTSLSLSLSVCVCVFVGGCGCGCEWVWQGGCA